MGGEVFCQRTRRLAEIQQTYMSQTQADRLLPATATAVTIQQCCTVANISNDRRTYSKDSMDTEQHSFCGTLNKATQVKGDPGIPGEKDMWTAGFRRKMKVTV